jgi:predicted amidohydrolase YtcJ
MDWQVLRQLATYLLMMGVFAAGARGSTLAAGKEPAAELAVRGATVVTMDAALPVASAIAVRNGEIVYVGDDAGLADYLGPNTRLLTDANITVLPGLTDAHAHLTGLGLSLGQIDLRGDSSPAAIFEKVRAAAQRPAQALDGEWLIGRGWDQNRFTPPRLPTVEDLQAFDAASGGRPVLLRRIDGHAIWVNSEALRRAGISRTDKPVPGGLILRRADGEPTGVLVDNAMSLVERMLPPLRSEQIEAAILRAGAYVTARGLTAVHDMGVSSAELEVYHRLALSGRLPLRVFAYYADPIPTALAQFPQSYAYRAEIQRLGQRLGAPEIGPLFTLRGIKLYMDGALGSRGAALAAPYSDEPQSSGLLLSPPEHIEAVSRWALLHGYQVATHAIGDRAVHLVLSAYEHAGVRAEKDLRFRIEHAQVLLPEELTRRRFLELGVIASVQPSHATSDMPWAGARLGPERLLNAYAWRSLLRSGARLCAGSDFPVEEADPRLILHAAVTRTDSQGNPPGGFFPGQRLSIGEAIRAMTSDAAYAVFAEDHLGQIAVGRPADLTILSGSLSLAPAARETPPSDLLQRQVLLTVIGGRVVYDGITKLGQPQKKSPSK